MSLVGRRHLVSRNTSAVMDGYPVTRSPSAAMYIFRGPKNSVEYIDNSRQLSGERKIRTDINSHLPASPDILITIHMLIIVIYELINRSERLAKIYNIPGNV